MSRNCSVCSNAEAAKIDAELCEKRDSIRVIAQRYALSPDALQRHRVHVEKKLARVAATKEQADVQTIETRLARALNRVEKWIEKLDQTNDYRAQSAHTRELRSLIELEAKLSGRLNSNPLVQVNVGAPPAAGAHPSDSFEDLSPESIAEDIESSLSPAKLEAVLALLTARQPITTTGTTVPSTAPQSITAPGTNNPSATQQAITQNQAPSLVLGAR